MLLQDASLGSDGRVDKVWNVNIKLSALTIKSLSTGLLCLNARCGIEMFIFVLLLISEGKVSKKFPY